MPTIESCEIDVGQIATQALDEIERQPKGTVYASRRGICAGMSRPGSAVLMFRRVGGTPIVRMEIRSGADGEKYAPPTYYPLPPDLLIRAAVMLDNL